MHHQAQRIFAPKLASALGSAATFGLIAAPLLPFPLLVSAALLAFGFGFFFLGGTGYRILIAVFLKDPARNTATTWSGAVAFSALAAIGVWAGLIAAGEPAAGLVLAAYAIAINTAYLFVKLACLEAGCCRAKQTLPRPRWLRHEPDLRLLEVLSTSAVLAFSYWGLFIMQNAPLAAIAGLGGHLAIRLFSRWARQRLPRSPGEIPASGLELIPLTLAALIAITTA